MFCQNCGKKIPDDSMFCPECGSKIGRKSETIQANRKEDGELKIENNDPFDKLHRNKKAVTLIGVIVVAVFSVFIISAVFAKPTINLNKYLTVSFDGYNTVGNALVNFDYEKFEQNYGKKLNKKSGKNTIGFHSFFDKNTSSESNDVDSVTNTFLSNCVSGSLDKSDGLSNGDVVVYTWECDDEYALETYGFILKYKDIEYTVKGLTEAETFDPFKGIEVLFSGIAPDGTAEITGEPTEDAAKYLYYKLDNYTNLSENDTVTAYVTTYDDDDPVEYCIENYGMIPSPLTKEYKVEGLDSYVTSISDISSDSLQEMQNQAEDVYRANAAKNWEDDAELDSFTYLGSYLLTKKSSGYEGTNNVFYLVYDAKVHNVYSDEDETFDEYNDVYWYICYYNLLVKKDGTTTVDTSYYQTPDDEFMVDSGISSGWWGTRSWYYSGYKTLDELYKNVVVAYSESYNHEENFGEEKINSDSVAEDKGNEAGIVFSNSSDELIDEADIQSLSDDELRYAINELYARHGYSFNDEELKKYYEKYDWYHPSIAPEDFSTDMFNDVERENIETMQRERDSRN